MTDAAKRLLYGYWPARQLAGEIPSALSDPQDYAGADVLNIACTQTGLSRAKQQRLVDGWLSMLPSVQASTIVFSSKITDSLFAAACTAPNLRALSVKWSSIESLEPLREARSLQALYLGSSPAVADLEPLRENTQLAWLFIENVKPPVNLEFLEALSELREFGISATRGKRLAVRSLQPIAGLSHLEMLWLVSIDVEEGGLLPLHSLERLKSLRSTLRKNSDEFRELCTALPSLEYFKPVG